MNYTLHQLRIFYTVVQKKNITKAAEMLHLTQPAVSIQLKKFLEQFDIPLLEIINRRIYITEAGEEVADAAERILAEADAITSSTSASKHALVGKLKLSIVSTGKYVAPYFLADFLKNQKGVRLFMDVTNKSQVLTSLEKNEVDFSLVSVLPETLAIEKVELMPNKLFLVGVPEKQYGNKVFDKSIFAEIPLIYREKGSGTRHVMEQYIKKNRLPVSMKMELTSNEAVKQAVIAGLGNSIMPVIGLKNELLNKELQIIRVKGFPIQSNWFLIWLRGKKLSAVAQAYLEYLKTEKQRIVKERFEWYEQY